MIKQFKIKKNIFRYLLIISIIYLLYSLYSLIILNIKLVDNNEDFIKNIVLNSNYHMLYEKKGKSLIYKLTTLFTNLEIKKPVTILEQDFGYKLNSNDVHLVYNENYENEIESVINYMSKPKNNSEPLVYIYNTHQTESYNNDYLKAYNITPNVLMASYLLKEKLEKLGIPTLVEESNITEFMRINNWVYKDSYKASRFYLLDTMNKYSNIKLFIDLHRDSVSHKNSTTKIGDKKYAKVLFVVGKEHENYKQNLELANYINNKIVRDYPSLSRGVLEKDGSGVNGIYNQDLSGKCMLLELGGNENNISEVLNTIEIMSNIIKEYIDEKRN